MDFYFKNQASANAFYHNVCIPSRGPLSSFETICVAKIEIILLNDKIMINNEFERFTHLTPVT